MSPGVPSPMVSGCFDSQVVSSIVSNLLLMFVAVSAVKIRSIPRPLSSAFLSDVSPDPLKSSEAITFERLSDSALPPVEKFESCDGAFETTSTYLGSETFPRTLTCSIPSSLESPLLPPVTLDLLKSREAISEPTLPPPSWSPLFPVSDSTDSFDSSPYFFCRRTLIPLATLREVTTCSILMLFASSLFPRVS